MTLLTALTVSLASTLRDVLPIALVVVVFQLFVLRRPIANWQRVVRGFLFVTLGLAVFLVGLEVALFPLGEAMAEQLASAELVGRDLAMAPGALLPWYRYHWVFLFAFAIGFSATIAEPALLAVAIKAHQVSGGTIHVWGLRAAVAIGSGIGVTLGTFRIVTGLPLPYFIMAGYLIVVVQTYFAPRQIVPLAYDSGGVTTSTVTVPLVVALGLGLAAQIPGRNPLADGFGMIALAVLFPMITVMGYAQLAESWNARGRSNETAN
ncbi:MAG: DUF1538 domain-containing protein [Pirellulales bacterium]